MQAIVNLLRNGIHLFADAHGQWFTDSEIDAMTVGNAETCILIAADQPGDMQLFQQNSLSGIGSHVTLYVISVFANQCNSIYHAFQSLIAKISSLFKNKHEWHKVLREHSRQCFSVCFVSRGSFLLSDRTTITRLMLDSILECQSVLHVRIREDLSLRREHAA